MADKKKKKTEGLKKTPSNLAGSRNLPDIKGFDDEQIKGIFKALGREDGINFDTEDSYKKFKKRYGIDLFNSSLKQSKLFISDNLKSFARYFVSVSLGFSVAFVPVVNNTVRSYSESYLDKFYQFLEIMPIKEQIWDIPVDNNSIVRLNEIINLCIKDKIPFKVNQTPDSYRVTIEFIAFSENQLNLKNLIGMPVQFEGDYTLVISSK